MRGIVLTICLFLWVMLGGCSHVISPEALNVVDPLVDFSRVKADPAAYRGKILLLGGLLVDTRVTREGTDLEVMLFTLDRWGRPLGVDTMGGRFIARTSRFLDPELFRAGLQVTLTGEVAGEEVRPLKGTDYHYPVFLVGELHLWQEPASVYGYRYYPADPWGPYYDPFWPSYNPYWYDRPAWRHR